MTQIIHPISKWTLHNDKLDVTIHANNIFDISSCAMYSGEVEKVRFPCTRCPVSDAEYLELMSKQGFVLTLNKVRK